MLLKVGEGEDIVACPGIKTGNDLQYIFVMQLPNLGDSVSLIDQVAL